MKTKKLKVWVYISLNFKTDGFKFKLIRLDMKSILEKKATSLKLQRLKFKILMYLWKLRCIKGKNKL